MPIMIFQWLISYPRFISVYKSIPCKFLKVCKLYTYEAEHLSKLLPIHFVLSFTQVSMQGRGSTSSGIIYYYYYNKNPTN